MKRKILIYTDSRGQHIPNGVPEYDIFPLRISQRPDVDAEVVLCPMKWTTTVDFLDYIKKHKPENYDNIILYTGIVDWSPRPQLNAINDLYDNKEPKNLDNIGLNTRQFAKKVINCKKPSFDFLFGEGTMLTHLNRDFGVEYEGQPTVNMYGLGMARAHLLPRLKELDNLLFINSNRFIPGWDGDYKRGRPTNIGITERYSALFRDELGATKVIDLLQWNDDEVMRLTCDNLHLTPAGSDVLYNLICSRLRLNAVSKRISPERPIGDLSAPISVKNVPLISVIVPVYNVQEYLRQCLDALARQDDENYEVVIVDDESTDASSGIISEYCRKYPSFTSIRQKNAGLGGARNSGTDICRGEFVTFVDSDDYVSNDYVSSLRAEQVRGDYDVVSGQFVRVTDNGTSLPRQVIDTHRLPAKFNHLKPYQIVLGVFRPSVAWARLYRRSLLIDHQIRFPPKMPHEDLFFTYKALFWARGSSEIEKEIYYYRQRPNSLSKTITETHVDAVTDQWRDTDIFLDSVKASDLDRYLAIRRTLIFLEGMWVRALRSSTDTQRYFRAKFLPRIEEIKDLLDRFRASAAGDTFPYERAEKLVKSLRAEAGEAIARPEKLIIDSPIELIFPHDNVNLTQYAKKEFESGAQPSPKIKDLHNKFKGQRCFIIGNGPSLNKNDLALLEGEYTFAVNSFYYKTAETGFRPTFFVVEDNMVLKDNLEEIKSYQAPYKIFPANYRQFIPEESNVYFFRANWGFYQKSSPYYCVPRFSVDALDMLYCGQTVTYINMQLAFYMGFTEVYLIGMDFNYVIPIEHKRDGNHILSTTDDPNHFHKDYFGKGKTWKDPKLDRVAASYRQAKVAYEAVGRKIYNATVGGKLDIFDRVDYETLLRDPRTGRKRTERIAPVVVKASENMAAAQLSGQPSQLRSAHSLPVPSYVEAAPLELSSAPYRPFYADFGEWLMWRSPSLFRVFQHARRAAVRFPMWLRAKAPPLFRLGQLVGWFSAAAWRHKLATLVLVLVCIALIGSPLYDARAWPWRLGLWAAAAVLLAAVAVGVVLRQTVRRLAAANEAALSKAVRSTSEASARQSRELEKRLAARVAQAEKHAEEAKIESRKDGEVAKAEAVRLIRNIEDRSRAEIDRLAASLREAVDDARTRTKNGHAHQAEVRAELSRMAEAVRTAEEALRADFLALRQGIDQRLHAEIKEQVEKLGKKHISEIVELQTTLRDTRQLIHASNGRIDNLDGITESVKTTVSAAQAEIGEKIKTINFLRERIAVGERQIGELRYPNAPDCFVFFGHHKCASRFFRLEVFERIAEVTGARTRRYEIKKPPFHYSRMDELDLSNINFKELGKNGRDVVWFANASERSLNKIKRSVKSWKGLRIIRDPRQVLISDYFHHKGDHPDVSPVGWVWDQLVKDKPILRELPLEEGLLHELDNITRQVIEEQILAPFDDKRVLTMKIEEFSEDPKAHLARIAEFLEVPSIAGIDFDNTKANPESGPWQNYFTSRLRDAFKERYGQALIDLGYAEDMDW